MTLDDIYNILVQINSKIDYSDLINLLVFIKNLLLVIIGFQIISFFKRG